MKPQMCVCVIVGYLCFVVFVGCQVANTTKKNYLDTPTCARWLATDVPYFHRRTLGKYASSYTARYVACLASVPILRYTNLWEPMQQERLFLPMLSTSRL